jgi:hypothetical protein
LGIDVGGVLSVKYLEGYPFQHCDTGAFCFLALFAFAYDGLRNVRIISRVNNTAKSDDNGRRHWVCRFLAEIGAESLGLVEDEIILVSDWWDKAQYCADLRAFIDDKVHILTHVADMDANAGCQPLHYSNWQNQYVDSDSRVWSVDNWYDLSKLFKLPVNQHVWQYLIENGPPAARPRNVRNLMYGVQQRLIPIAPRAPITPPPLRLIQKNQRRKIQFDVVEVADDEPEQISPKAMPSNKRPMPSCSPSLSDPPFTVPQGPSSSHIPFPPPMPPPGPPSSASPQSDVLDTVMHHLVSAGMGVSVKIGVDGCAEVTGSQSVASDEAQPSSHTRWQFGQGTRWHANKKQRAAAHNAARDAGIEKPPPKIVMSRCVVCLRDQCGARCSHDACRNCCRSTFSTCVQQGHAGWQY